MTRLVLCLAWALAVPRSAWSQSPDEMSSPEGAAPRNPAFLRAGEVFIPRDPGGSRVVRLEWEQVNATEYVLQGQWVEPESWATHRRELTVSAVTASQWDERLVATEVRVEPGAHSWLVVAVFAGKGPGDFARPTRATFEVR